MSDAALKFRRLLALEFEAAYGIVQESDAWLANRGYPHWLMSRDDYHKRQENGCNYGLFVGDSLAVVVSLSEYRPDDWQNYFPMEPFTWLSSLNTARAYGGRGLGLATLRAAHREVALSGVGSIFLDTYYGWLVDYYKAVGYSYVERKVLHFSDGTLHDSVLMVRRVLPEDVEFAATRCSG